MTPDLLIRIVDEHSGGVKGLELLGALIEHLGPDVVNPSNFLDDVEALILKSVPELGFLRYSFKIDATLYREKAFIYRK